MNSNPPMILNIRISDCHSKILEIHDDDDVEQRSECESDVARRSDKRVGSARFDR